MSSIATWMPAITVGLTITGGAIAYLWQKQADKKHELLQQKRSAYTKLLVALNRHLTHQCLPNLANLNEARAEVFIVSSDEVAKSVGGFFEQAKRASIEEQLQGSANNPTEMLKFYAEMVLAMRQDCFEKSKLNIAETIECMPIEYSDEKEKTVVR